MGITKLENESLIPGIVSALLLFIFLAFPFSGIGSIFVAAIIALVAFPVTTLLSSLGISILNTLPKTNIIIRILIAVILGAIFGAIGNATANLIMGFNGINQAFIFTGAATGLLVSLQPAANK